MPHEAARAGHGAEVDSTPYEPAASPRRGDLNEELDGSPRRFFSAWIGKEKGD